MEMVFSLQACGHFGVVQGRLDGGWRPCTALAEGSGILYAAFPTSEAEISCCHSSPRILG